MSRERHKSIAAFRSTVTTVMTSATPNRPLGLDRPPKILEVEINALTPQVLTDRVAEDEESGHKFVYSRLCHRHLHRS